MGDSCWVVIPARWGSTRLPGKPLARIGDLPMVERVRRACVRSDADRVVVATDDVRICEVVRRHGGEAVLTGSARCGTERVWAALEVLGAAPDLVVNVQGDLPLLPPAAVSEVIALLRGGSQIATLATAWPAGVPIEDPAVVKVERDAGGRALRFTRRPIRAWRHVGIYGFRFHALRRAIATRGRGAEQEDLEQVAWMQAGLPVDIAVISDAGPSIDTPEQLDSLRLRLANPMYPSVDPRVTSGPEVVE